MSDTIRRKVEEDVPEKDVEGKSAKKNRRINRARKSFLNL